MISLPGNGLRLLAFSCLGLIATAGLPESVKPVLAQVHCNVRVQEPIVCVHASLLVTIHCQNDSEVPVEWIDQNYSRVHWELTYPDGHSERAVEGRYPVSPNLISLAPGQESTAIAPITRLFEVTSAGPYRLRLGVGTSDSGTPQADEVDFTAEACVDGGILAACREFLQGPKSSLDTNLEAVGGFDSPAAVPCMSEALIPNSIEFVSIFAGLARIHTPEAVHILVERFDDGDAFVRLAAWGALQKVDKALLSPELRQEVGRVLNEVPTVFVAE